MQILTQFVVWKDLWLASLAWFSKASKQSLEEVQAPGSISDPLEYAERLLKVFFVVVHWL